MCTVIEMQKWKRMELFMLSHANSALKVGKGRGTARFLGARGE